MGNFGVCLLRKDVEEGKSKKSRSESKRKSVIGGARRGSPGAVVFCCLKKQASGEVLRVQSEGCLSGPHPLRDKDLGTLRSWGRSQAGKGDKG